MIFVLAILKMILTVVICIISLFIYLFTFSAFDIAYLFCFILRKLIAHKPSGYFMSFLAILFYCIYIYIIFFLFLFFVFMKWQNKLN